MDWFKHYADMHQGRSINLLMDKMGHTGLCFFLIQEMCAKKFDKKAHENATESDCVFGFHQRVVMQNLRIRPVRLKQLLDSCSVAGLLSFSYCGNLIEISMPILLDLRAKDTRNAKRRRLIDASKCVQDKDKDKDKDNAQLVKPSDGLTALAFENFYKKFPKKLGKSKGLRKFKSQIKDEKDYQQLDAALQRFLDYHKSKGTETQFIPQFDTFMNNWKDWLDPETGTSEKLQKTKPVMVVRE